LHFKNGEATLPPAYKETKPLKSVLEADKYVYEVPVKKIGGNEIVFDGPYTNADGKIEIEIPGIKQCCFISQQKLNELISKYGGRRYPEVENGHEVNYVCFSIDIKTLLKYCGIG
jgi:hypothetical protein